MWSGLWWREGRDQWSWVPLDRTCSCNLDLLFCTFALPRIAVTAKSWQTDSVNSRRSGQVMRCEGVGGWLPKGVTRCSVLRAPCSSRGVPVRWLSRATGVWKPVGCFLYLLWPLPSTFCFCSCIFYDSFTCARVGFCKWQFYRFVVDVCSLNASLVLPPPLPVTPWANQSKVLLTMGRGVLTI